MQYIRISAELSLYDLIICLKSPGNAQKSLLEAKAIAGSAAFYGFLISMALLNLSLIHLCFLAAIAAAEHPV